MNMLGYATRGIKVADGVKISKSADLKMSVSWVIQMGPM